MSGTWSWGGLEQEDSVLDCRSLINGGRWEYGTGVVGVHIKGVLVLQASCFLSLGLSYPLEGQSLLVFAGSQNVKGSRNIKTKNDK